MGGCGFLYRMGVTLQWESVQLLARLGGWEPRPNRPPGKLTLTRSSHRLLDMLTTDAGCSQRTLASMGNFLLTWRGGFLAGDLKLRFMSGCQMDTH